MLSEWYFCCCISAHPSDTEAFLSILDVLENPESDSQLLYLAYNELERTEGRMQIYSLPVVLKSLRRENFPDGLKEKIERYLNNLIENVPEKVKQSVQQLIKLALLNETDNFTKIIKVVKTFIKESQNLQERRLSPTPYIELKDFLPETLVLAIIADIADRLENNENLVNKFIAAIKDNDETSSSISISSFLEAALENQFGRLAFRLAASIASLTSTADIELRDAIAQQASLAAHTEPDLLQTYALILFRDTSQENITSKQCDRIIEESLSLFELRALIQHIPVNSSALNLSFRSIGIPNNPNRSDGLPVFYWQVILWELAAKIDALATAKQLEKFWKHPETGRLPPELLIYCDEADNPATVQTQFNSLIELLKLRGIKTLKVNPTKKAYIKNNQFIWLFLSPWFKRTANPRQPYTRLDELYPNVDEPTLLIRMMGSVFVAIRLLQKLAHDRNNWEQVEFAARFLAHASDIVTTIEKRNNRKKEGETSLLSDSLTGLFQFSKRQIRLVGNGQLESIDPEIFVKICEEGLSFQKKNSSNKEETTFLDLVLPEVLISWIENAYPGIVSSQRSERWLNFIKRVYNCHTAYDNIPDKRHKFVERQKAALVVRFLVDTEFSFTPDDKLNWKTEYSEKGASEIKPRKLLLTRQKPKLHPNEWMKLEKDLEKVKSRNESDPKISISNLLVCTLELLDALGKWPNFEIKAENLEDYFTKLKSYLYSAEKSRDIDRFTRLRLVEFLDSSMLENRSEAEEQILIASVLLEYGSIYDLKKMLEKVYGREKDEKTFKETTDARDRLQVALLPMIYKRLEKETELLQNIHYGSDDLSQSRKAQSPRETYKSLQNAELFKEWVRKLLYLSSIEENAEDFSKLGLNLANLYHQSLERQANSTIRAKTLNVELRNNPMRLVLGQKLTNLVIKGINYNPNQFTAKVFYEEFDTKKLDGEKIENLFQNPPANNKDSLNVQALVVNVDRVEQDDRHQWIYTFDCGFEFLLTHSSNKDLSFQAGVLVKLPIEKFQFGNESKWEVSELDSIEPLTHKIQLGDICQISIDENWQDSPRTLSLQRNNDIIEQVDLTVWDADISRCFCQPSASLKPYDVLAKLNKLDKTKGNKQPKWIPLDLGFTDLLSQLCYPHQSNSKLYYREDRSNIAVFTFIEETIGKFGEKAWRFSRRPGENYLIEEHYFLGDDSDKLADWMANYDDAVGLLIAVKLGFEANRVGLQLVDDESIDIGELEVFYPNLEFPDDRNIKWRELFAGSNERLTAEKDAHGNWYYYLDENKLIPGYPSQVIVEWDRDSRRELDKDADTKIADLIISKWQASQWRTASIEGGIPPYYEINLGKKSPEEFLAFWLDLPERNYIEAGKRVTLNRYSLGSIERDNDGFVSCFTNENMLVWVQVESLTMLPQEEQTKVPIGEKREAEIFWIEWRRNSVLPEINGFPPAEVSQNNGCSGIIAKVPRSTKDGTQCQVIWEVSSGKIKEQNLQIDNLSEIRLNQGYKIVAYKNKEEWQFHIERPYIRVRALWSLKELKGTSLDKLHYLGKLFYNDKEVEVAEQESHPGQLVYWSARDEEISHLAVGTKDKFSGFRVEKKGWWEDCYTRNTAGYRKNFYDKADFLYRAIFKFGDRLLIGDCKKQTGNEKVSVKKITLVSGLRPDKKIVLQRQFELHLDLRQNLIRRQERTNTDAELWLKRLKEYLNTRRSLTATLDPDELGFSSLKGESGEIRLPQDASENNWTDWVQLAPEEGKFVMAGNYSDEADICLFSETEKGPILASCRRVPPMTLEYFRCNYCEAALPNTNVLLKNKGVHLYYVGPEDESTVESNQETHHQFEIGYGKTLRISESQLEFNGGSFSQAQFSLFHGDQIKVISFKKALYKDSANSQETPDGDEDGANNQKMQYILNIESIYIEWSEARKLYEQRKLNIVHLLHLKPQSKNLEINYIDGFNENTNAQSRKFDAKRSKAFISEDSQNRLKKRQQRWVEEEESDPVIFGRLDEESYRKSRGRKIYFDHVRLSFEESSEGSCLFNGEMVFLRGGEINLGKNDIALTLKPPKGLDPEDVGKDGKGLRLLRRSFSVRENLLKQVYEEKGKMEFADDRLLIQLTEKYGKMMAFGDQVPPRKAPALRGAISNRGLAGLFAAVVFVRDGAVKIEYKPGIFIRLKTDLIEFLPENLQRGTLVRITNTPDEKFKITRAAFGNAEYLESPRPAVMLPKNSIERMKPEEWKQEGRFTIGGMPNIVASFGDRTEDREESENTELEAITDLMATKHPKIVCLSKNGQASYIAPPSDLFPCGRLVKLENSLEVRYVPLHSEAKELNNPIPWHLLSFGDESVDEIMKRADSESWRYHDETTFTWKTDAEKFVRQGLKNRYYTIWSGPIFFQLVNEEMRLRYTKGEFRRFGFPVEELISTLKDKKDKSRSHLYPIAGVYTLNPKGSKEPEYSLWIELAPGRLVELPTQLIVWRSDANKKERSLTDLMHWQGFAPGDRVELEIVSTDTLIIDRIALKQWIPGIRNVLGSTNQCFLPVKAVKKGEITLGEGEFQLKLPFTDENPNLQMVVLTPGNNHIQEITVTSSMENPKPNDVVFLELNAQDQLAVVGFETIQPHIKDKDVDVVKNIIRAAGALPVTVEGFNTENRHLLFSMRYQEEAARILPDRISVASFVDILPDAKTAILRCGGGLISLPMRKIVPGVPRSLYNDAAQKLKEADFSLWLRNEQDQIKVGFRDDSQDRNLFVKSLNILLKMMRKLG